MKAKDFKVWDVLLDWLQTTGLTPDDVINAVLEYQDHLAEITREQIRKIDEKN